MSNNDRGEEEGGGGGGGGVSKGRRVHYSFKWAMTAEQVSLKLRRSTEPVSLNSRRSNEPEFWGGAKLKGTDDRAYNEQGMLKAKAAWKLVSDSDDPTNNN